MVEEFEELWKKLMFTKEEDVDKNLTAAVQKPQEKWESVVL